MQSSNGGDRPIDKVMPAASIGLLTRDEAWAAGKCVCCKQVVVIYRASLAPDAPVAPPGVQTNFGTFSETNFHSEAGRREWAITAFCEKCFDEVMTDDV